MLVEIDYSEHYLCEVVFFLIHSSFYWCFHIDVISVNLVIPNVPRKNALNTLEVTKGFQISGDHVKKKEVIGKTH